jgi:hypothetical protein
MRSAWKMFDTESDVSKNELKLSFSAMYSQGKSKMLLFFWVLFRVDLSQTVIFMAEALRP